MNNEQAFEQALRLAISAPSDRKAWECTVMAEGFAASLDEVTIMRIKNKIENES